MDKVIRVAQIIGIAGAGGVESVVMNYYKNIDKTKVQFDFFVESPSIIIDKELIESMGGNIVIIPPYKRIFSFLLKLTKLLKEKDYDIIHSNMNALSVFSLFAAFLAGKKIRIAHSHTTTNKKEWKKNILKSILQPFSKVFATHYFACSEKAGRWLFGNKTFEQGKVEIINNAVNLNRFKYDTDLRNKVRKELKINDEFVVGHIGRFVTVKNHEFIIEMFNEFQKNRPASKLLLIGDGEGMEKIKQLLSFYKLEDKVLFIGAVSNPQDYYQAMDVFILPSLYEGLPVVGVEAQTSLLPSLFSNNVTKEVLINNNAKQIPLELNEWIKELENIDVNNRVNVENKVLNSRFNISNEAKKLEEKYLNILSKK